MLASVLELEAETGDQVLDDPRGQDLAGGRPPVYSLTGMDRDSDQLAATALAFAGVQPRPAARVRPRGPRRTRPILHARKDEQVRCLVALPNPLVVLEKQPGGFRRRGHVVHWPDREPERGRRNAPHHSWIADTHDHPS